MTSDAAEEIGTPIYDRLCDDFTGGLVGPLPEATYADAPETAAPPAETRRDPVETGSSPERQVPTGSACGSLQPACEP
jgi:hypothetical protein